MTVQVDKDFNGNVYDDGAPICKKDGAKAAILCLFCLNQAICRHTALHGACDPKNKRPFGICRRGQANFGVIFDISHHASHKSDDEDSNSCSDNDWHA